MDFPPGYLEHHAGQLTFLSHFHQDQYRAQAHLRQASVTLLDNQTSYGPLLATSLAQTGLKSLKLVSCTDLARQDLAELPGYEKLAAELRGQAPFTELSTERWGYEWMAPATEVAPPLGTEASYGSLAPLVEGAGLVVVLTEGYSTHICDVINELALKKNFRWLNLSLKGSQVLVGPAILPHGTACWRCYQSRVWANAAREESYEMLERFDAQYHAARRNPNYGQLAAIGQVAAGLGANEVIKALTLYAGTVYGRVHSFNAVTFQSQQSEVLRLPRCKACGRDGMRVPNKLWYSSRPLTERRESHA
jgi:bacteriocin biosynthesis cyclodehydratase domain-containing protein